MRDGDGAVEEAGFEGDDFFEGEDEVFVAELIDEEDIDDELDDDPADIFAPAGAPGRPRGHDDDDEDPADQDPADEDFDDDEFDDEDDFDDDFDDDDAPLILPRPDHPVSRKKISSPALKVLYRLNKT
ncbi:MAG: hypothetical protein AAFX50_22025, partial [Acidobacteriota bacterium]